MKQDSERKTIEKIFEFVDFTGKDVLEIGCGDGRLTSWLVGKPNKLIAIEPDEACLEKARQTIPGAEFQVGSGEALSFNDASFDIVLFSLSLHHQNSGAALEEAARVLKDTGVVLVLEPLDEGGLERVCAMLRDESREKQQAQRAIAESDLALVRCEAFFATWRFDSEDELFQWVFAYYDVPFNAALALQMADLPEVRHGAPPIVLQDTMVLQLLCKNSQ